MKEATTAPMDGRCLLAIRLKPAGVFRFGDDAGGPVDYSCSQATEKAEPPDVDAEGSALATPWLVSMVSASCCQAVSPIGLCQASASRSALTSPKLFCAQCTACR